MRVVTISPVFTAFSLKPGIDPRSAIYGEILNALPSDGDGLVVPNRGATGGDYENLAEDGYDLRLLEWRRAPDENGPEICFHIYPNGVSIAHIEFSAPQSRDAAALEQFALSETRKAIDRYAGELRQMLGNIAKNIPAKYLESRKKDAQKPPKVSWIARTLVFSEEERRQAGCQRLIGEWLKDTAHPEDAAKLIEGDIDYSMTWVNYVIVDSAAERTRMLLSAMRIAQFFYAAQKALNDQTQSTISRAYFTKNIREAEALLVNARARMQMLRIQYGVQKNYLNWNKRRVIEDIMKVWDFEALIANGARMSEASSAKINEITAERRERSAIITDLILVGIGFLAVIDVSLGLTEYSREVMSRPALEYTDSQSSWILSGVASVDVDAMLVGGAVIIILLVGLYGYWKLKK